MKFVSVLSVIAAAIAVIICISFKGSVSGKLDDYSDKVSKAQKQVVSLKSEIDERDKELLKNKTEIENYKKQVSDLNNKVQEMSKKIADMDE